MRWKHLGYLLLLFLPVAIYLRATHGPPLLTFATSGLGIVPLAALMGRATDVLADRLGPTLGGLLNATFGNAAELILAIVALRRGFVIVVKASLVGSIIGNALLTLGVSLLVGGLRHQRQRFDRVHAGLQATLLVLAAIGMLFPSALFHELPRDMELRLSAEVSVVLLATYALSVLFSLLTPAGQQPELAPPPPGHDGPHWGTGVAVFVLAASTALVAVLSEFLAGAIEDAQQLGTFAALGMSDVFLGVIVVAIIGNAAEHSTAIVMAYHNKVDVSLHISVGSSLQIALLVTPMLVLLSLVIAPEPLDLHFSVLELLAVGASVIVVALVAADGESNWMEGVLLLAVYLILGLAFYHMPVTH